MADDEPIARWPDKLELDLTEVREVLEALDDASERLPSGSPEAEAARTATVLMTGKVWPDLGRLHDDEE